MRLARSWFVLIVVLSTSAWGAPTQAELPISWPRAALPTEAVAERDMRVVVGCASAAQGADAHACDRLTRRLDGDGCRPGQASRPRKVGQPGDLDRTGTGMDGTWSTRGQIKPAFSNGTAGDERQRRSADL
ncbi:hypothetical protein M0D46_07650 [Xanthomonas prunicola]|uniref:Secreted protein n=1 Tax=Xanthomonas prunicola TaxID=2053930 RepID=A0A9Q9MNE7_9XANT|nr:hypothetical protein [Xanthomonas prunicola]UXA50860.1 hypothetical protein M0D44_10470 [Xanthomonas prunicola]UXA51389.1 hypothetical protein M0D45_11525 [Xanthomonas prunicola]UXA59168.1 hypothetical protein M0D47_10510 [Xanthomonas prunicola]UXA61307.1 hypothetical protein M0D48_20795 [Xanthomonas prunicola]UXA67376.1 hypothetical protein M0D43_10735 [Xanthomonas prunicola]